MWWMLLWITWGIHRYTNMEGDSVDHSASRVPVPGPLRNRQTALVGPLPNHWPSVWWIAQGVVVSGPQSPTDQKSAVHFTLGDQGSDLGRISWFWVWPQGKVDAPHCLSALQLHLNFPDPPLPAAGSETLTVSTWLPILPVVSVFLFKGQWGWNQQENSGKSLWTCMRNKWNDLTLLTNWLTDFWRKCNDFVGRTYLYSVEVVFGRAANLENQNDLKWAG